MVGLFAKLMPTGRGSKVGDPSPIASIPCRERHPSVGASVTLPSLDASLAPASAEASAPEASALASAASTGVLESEGTDVSATEASEEGSAWPSALEGSVVDELASHRPSTHTVPFVQSLM